MIELTVADVAAARVELFRRGLCPLGEADIPATLIPVFEGKADVRWAAGGRGGAKSWSFAKMAAVWAASLDATGQTGVVLCIRQFMNSLDDSSFQDIKSAIQSDAWLSSVFEVGDRYIRTRSKRIRFIFAGTSVNLSSIKSKSRILLCLAEEAEQIPDSAWEQIIPTVRQEGSETWAIWNPESPKSWVHKNFRLSDDPLIKGTMINWHQNPWFTSKMDRDRLRTLHNDPDNYEHVWEGAFKTNLEGAYYATQLNQAQLEHRITKVPHDPALPVRTYWDLGLDDATSIWFVQELGREIRLIEYAEWTQTPLTAIAGEVMGRPYTYSDHILPHDVRVRELTTGRSREEVLRSLLGRMSIAPMLGVEDGINAVRVLFSRLWFDEKKCEAGIDALRNYAKRWDDKRKTFEERPYHNWASHGADAMRMLGVSYKEKIDRGERERYGRRTVGRKGSAWAA